MEIYFLRHAIGVPRGTPGYPDDSRRPLTKKGAAKMERIARGLCRLGLEFDLILSSPYTRARKTAEIVTTVYGGRVKLKLTDALASTGKPRALLDELNKVTAGKVLLVGHEPCLSALLSVLLAGQTNLSMDLKKGGVGKITVQTLRFGQCAKLNWLLMPKQLVLIGKA